MTRSHRLWLCGVALVLATGRLQALEPWADPALPVTNGLALWLDASRENAARSSNAVTRVAEAGPLNLWHDASGNGRNLNQPTPSARPRLLHTSDGVVARFDGADDFLFTSAFNQEFPTATVFLRASPRSNPGALRGLLAAAKASANDYSTGFSLDLGPQPSARVTFVNVEGCGSVGIQNLANASFAFGEAHQFTLQTAPGKEGVRLWLDGVPQRTRSRDWPVSSWQHLALGARLYSNTAEPAHVQGFYDGDISEVLVFNRILTDAERTQVERYLASKHRPTTTPGRHYATLTALSNPPPVQVFVPGFSVHELPVKLSNINDVKYREDGKLVALGYDGNIWLLSDTDGDGLEDKAAPFWNKPSLRAPIGLALTPPGYPRGRGVFVPAKGKVSLIVDTNNDDFADEEIIVAQGWGELPHGVDALGAALDKDGNLYFGLGTANFTDAYLANKSTGRADYSLKNERGTILKVSPDFKHREIVCTGIRFPVAMAFNAVGDLFTTDQEGATWLPNGNPFDELLHIQAGLHYGFPPRHPRLLPSVVDEPSVFDYAPQHQSTCGLNFNEPVNGGKTFGPDWWRGDALVTGYSRGKLWRTKLVKTVSGYVAQSQLFASLDALPADACVSPQGDLVVAAHSGEPDWGSGPNGAGKLYKISFAVAGAPQPVLVWPGSPTETLIEFDRVLNPLELQHMVKNLKLIEGRYVAAGDDFEVRRPGYQVVQNQLAEPRYELDIHSVQLDADGRTLIIRSTPRAQAMSFAITLPQKTTPAKAPPITQLPRIDLSHDLSGVETSWRPASGTNPWVGWLPHPDLSVARAFTANSARHDSLWKSLSLPGELTLRAQLDLGLMLRAATQPGSKLDFAYPAETVTVVFRANALLRLTATNAVVERVSETESCMKVSPAAASWQQFELVLATRNGIAPTLDIAWFTAEDARLRPLPLRRILLPWVTPAGETTPPDRAREIPELAGGNWLRGKHLFFGDQQACSKCHQVGGTGGKVGPDLSNLIHRDLASVLKDIQQPSAAINPDHVAYNVALTDGESLTAVAVGGNEREVVFADASGKAVVIPKNRIVSMRPSSLSLMPEGLLLNLSEQQKRDLLAFLLLPPPLSPAPLEASGEPPARKRAEFEPVLRAAAAVPAVKPKELKIVLAAGPKDHGPGEHDYPLWQARWKTLLGLADGVTVETADRWPSAAQLASANVIVFYSNNPEWNAARAPELDAFLKRGGGLVYIHYAVDGQKHCDELAARIGLAWRGGASKFRHGPLDLKLQPHEITAGLPRLGLVDESYWQLIGSEKSIQLLASGVEEGAPQPLLWAKEQNGGRVFVSIPGHYTWTFDDPLFRLLLLRGMAWTAREPMDRLAELSTIGARIGD